MISKSADNAQSLVDKVLEMEALNQENIGLKKESIDIYQVITDVTENLSENAEKKQITIDIKKESTVRVVYSDSTYLSLIFENLISNAIKFSPKEKKVSIIISGNTTHVKTEIIDEGPGINPKEEHLLFKKFSKLSSRPTGGESSTGLGLSLVKRYVSLIHGKVWYEGKQNVGAKFVVEVPVQ